MLFSIRTDGQAIALVLFSIRVTASHVIESRDTRPHFKSFIVLTWGLFNAKAYTSTQAQSQ